MSVPLCSKQFLNLRTNTHHWLSLTLTAVRSLKQTEQWFRATVFTLLFWDIS